MLRDRPIDNDPVWVSADAFSGCFEAANQSGFDILPYLARHEIDAEIVNTSNGLIPFSAMCACLEDVALQENCPDFGFRLAKLQKPLQFGLISQLLLVAPTVGEAIRIFLKYRYLFSQSSHWNLHVEDGVAYLRRYDTSTTIVRGSQMLTYAMTRGFEAIRSLAGSKWAPIGVYLTTDAVAVSSAMRRHFGAPFFFNSQHDEIAFADTDLARPIPTGNPELLAAMTVYFDRLLPQTPRGGPISNQVERILRAQIGSSSCSLAAIARDFAMHPRTLQRALSAEGTSFRSMTQNVRMQIARQLIEKTKMPFSDIAPLAGYQHLSSFSRAVQRGRGGSARTLRAENGVAIT